MIDHKEAVREVVREYLLETHPEHTSEFDSVFDTVYRTLQRREPEAPQRDLIQTEDAASFHATVGESAVLGVACFVGYAILKATLKDIAENDLPGFLDTLEARLVKLTGQQQLVSSIRRRVERILKKM